MKSNRVSMDNGWNEYGKLVLKELERLNEGQAELRKDIDQKFNELAAQMTALTTDHKNIENDVHELKRWKENVQEVWSVTQMRQSKDELYKQKNNWQKVAGILVAIQILWGIIIVFKDKLF